MKKRKEKFKIAPTKIFITIIAVLVVLILVSIFSQEKAEPIEERNFTVEDNNQEVYIDYPNGPANLLLTGFGNNVMVSKNTNLLSVKLFGIGNKLHLCENIHNPEIEKAGLSTEVIYETC